MLENKTGLNTTYNVHLTFNNLDGSVEHYYHFLLGFFVPMVIACEKLLEDDDVQHVYVRSCGIFDDFIRFTGCPEIIIINKDTHLKAKQEGTIEENGTLPLKFIEYSGYDTLRGYEVDAFNQVSTLIKSRYCQEIAKEKVDILRNRKNQNPIIVFIDRHERDPFFLYDECELNTPGSQRRSIENITELKGELVSIFPDVICTTLEDKSLFYQIALFASADVIIAQHGAALANLIWCSSKTTLIEVLSGDNVEITNSKSCFTHLAACMSVPFRTVRQKGTHGYVDIGMLIKALHSIYPENNTLKQRLFLEKESRSKILPELFPVYGSQYSIVVRKDEFYIQAGDGSLKAQLTPSAAIIFEACLGNKNIGQIVSDIKVQYPNAGTKQEIQKDVMDVIDELIEKGIVDLKKRSPFPDFIIIGAMKSGTTALKENLSRHPDVYMAGLPRTGEVNYFSGSSWHKGAVWYRQLFSADKRLQGEKTPLYIGDKQAMNSMYELLPEAKIIVLLRNPVTRAYSQWNHFNQAEESNKWGWKVCDFEKSIELNPDILKRGLYAQQLKDVYKLYPKERVFVGIAERFRRDSRQEYARICDFLGVSRISGDYTNEHIRRYSSKQSADMVEHLTEYYRPHNEALFDMLGYRVDEWY